MIARSCSYFVIPWFDRGISLARDEYSRLSDWQAGPRSSQGMTMVEFRHNLVPVIYSIAPTEAA